MMKHLLLLSVFLLLGCEPQKTVSEFVVPFTGKSEPMVTTALDGWDAHQLEAAPAGYIMLSQSGRPIVVVSGEGARRDIGLFGRSSGDLLMLKTDRNGAFEQIEFDEDGVFYRLRRHNQEWVLEKHGNEP